MGDRHYFIVNPAAVQGNRFALDKTETHHLQKVLRMQIGTELWLIDGCGTTYQARLSNSVNGLAEGDILAVYPDAGESVLKIHLALGLIKRDNLEFAVEKAVELGAASITPLLLNRSIKRELRIERTEKIIIKATKQSGRSRFAKLLNPISLTAWLKRCTGHSILVCHSSGTETISDWYRSQARPQAPISVLIGPEGDFSEDELDRLQRSGGKFVTLGNRRLRSETAAIAALSVLNDCANMKGIGHE